MAIAPKKLATAVSATITGPVLTLAFSNGKTLSIDANALSPDIQHAAMMHGLKQKLIDAAAISRDPDTGRTATIDDKFNAVHEVYTRITLADAPTWNKIRSTDGNGNGGNKGGLLLRAMMRITSKPRTEIMTYLDGLNKAEVAALRKNPRIAEVIAQLQVETANTSGVDSDALLDSLMSGGGNDMGEGAEGDMTDTDDAEGEDAPDASGAVPPAPSAFDVPPVAAKKGRAKKPNGAVKE